MITANRSTTVHLLPFERIGVPHTDDTRTASVVSVVGDINWTTSGELRAHIDELLAGDRPARIILDLQEVNHIDSSGIGALLGGLRDAREKCVPFTLSGLHGSPRRVMERTHLSMLFDIRPTVDEALHA